jgi:hypothetical protein
VLNIADPITMSLSPADITKLMAGTRLRGAYEPVIREFGTSGELYLDVKSLPQFSTRENLDSLKNSFSENLKKVVAAENGTFPKVTVIKTDETVLLVNTDVHAAQVAAEQS